MRSSSACIPSSATQAAASGVTVTGIVLGSVMVPPSGGRSGPGGALPDEFTKPRLRPQRRPRVDATGDGSKIAASSLEGRPMPSGAEQAVLADFADIVKSNEPLAPYTYLR